MSALVHAQFDKSTSFSQEVKAIEELRRIRRSGIKNYPKVSVLVSTLRADDLTSLLGQLLNQSLPSFELLLGLHIISLNPTHKKLIAQLTKRKVTVKIREFTKEFNLGTILSTLAQSSTGEYIAKMDDDDYYGPEHLRDLVDAALDTGADVVGRAMNYVYLEPLQLTVRQIGRAHV